MSVRRLTAAALILLASSGCPGELANRDVYPEIPILLCNDDVMIDVEAILSSPRCAASGCHTAVGGAAELDLESPGAFGRMLDHPSEKTDCGDRTQLLIDRNAPDQSFVILKLQGTLPGSQEDCGDQMPFSDTFSPRELACFRRWVLENVEAAESGGVDAGTPAMDAGESDGG